MFFAPLKHKFKKKKTSLTEKHIYTNYYGIGLYRIPLCDQTNCQWVKELNDNENMFLIGHVCQTRLFVFFFCWFFLFWICTNQAHSIASRILLIDRLTWHKCFVYIRWNSTYYSMQRRHTLCLRASVHIVLSLSVSLPLGPAYWLILMAFLHNFSFESWHHNNWISTISIDLNVYGFYKYILF